jgi:hypothetical protein
MASLSLREAAEQAGTSKSTIWRAIRGGRLSATRMMAASLSTRPSCSAPSHRNSPRDRTQRSRNGQQRQKRTIWRPSGPPQRRRSRASRRCSRRSGRTVTSCDRTATNGAPAFRSPCRPRSAPSAPGGGGWRGRAPVPTIFLGPPQKVIHRRLAETLSMALVLAAHIVRDRLEPRLEAQGRARREQLGLLRAQATARQPSAPGWTRRRLAKRWRRWTVVLFFAANASATSSTTSASGAGGRSSARPPLCSPPSHPPCSGDGARG